MAIDFTFPIKNLRLTVIVVFCLVHLVYLLWKILTVFPSLVFAIQLQSLRSSALLSYLLIHWVFVQLTQFSWLYH